MEDIVKGVNKSLDDGTPEQTHSLLQKPEGMFPKVLPRSAFLYHDGLFKAKQVRYFFANKFPFSQQDSVNTCSSVKFLFFFATFLLDL